MISVSDRENAECMTHDVMDIVSRLVRSFGPHVFVVLLLLCCACPGMWREPEIGSCEDQMIGWTSEGDFCYDGTVGPSKPVTGACCDAIKATMGQLRHSRKEVAK